MTLRNRVIRTTVYVLSVNPKNHCCLRYNKKGVNEQMFASINQEFNRAKSARRERQFIIESVLGIDEVLPGSDDELEDVVDSDSVPDDVYKKLDAELDKIVEDPNYDDTEVDEMLDDEDIPDEEIEALIEESCNAWVDPESLGHPDLSRRTNEKDQPLFKVKGQKSL